MTSTKPKKSFKSSISNFLKRYQDGPKSLEKGKFICCFLFVLVPIIHFFVFYIGGNYYSFFLAFTQVDGIDANNHEIYKFSLTNFVKVWEMITSGDSGLIIALKNTALLFVAHSLQLCFNFVIAYSFTRKLRGSKFFRVALYLPSIISTLILSIVVKNMLTDGGPLSQLWVRLTDEPFPMFFADDKTAFPTLVFYCIWAGFYQYLLIFEGAIRRVPQEVLESARLDGVNTWQELWLIIIPIMWDTISTIIVLTVCSLFTISAPVLLFTDGAYNTQTLSFWFYQQVYEYPTVDSLNVSAAVGIAITVINLPIVFGVRKLLSKVSDSIEY